jgi:hypothetical protein
MPRAQPTTLRGWVLKTVGYKKYFRAMKFLVRQKKISKFAHLTPEIIDDLKKMFLNEKK